MGRMTLWGIDQYLDGGLLAQMQIPPSLSMDVLKNKIMRECGELYPFHQVPPVLVQQIGSWSMERLAGWQRIAAALAAEYNPIENYDRTEVRHYQEKGTDTDTTTLGSSNTVTPGDRTTSSTGVSAFDADTYAPREQNVTQREGTIVSENSGTDSLKKQYGRGTDEDSHIHGNIGVTTNQQMIESEIALRTMHNLYDIITREFEAEFLVQIY